MRRPLPRANTSYGDYKMKSIRYLYLVGVGESPSLENYSDSGEVLCAILGGEASMKKRRKRSVASISVIEGHRYDM